MNDSRSPGTLVNVYGERNSDWDFISCGYRSAHTVQSGLIRYQVSSYSMATSCFTATQDELNLLQPQFFQSLHIH